MTPEVRPPPPPDRYPFWGYADLFLFLGLSLPCLLAGALIVRLLFATLSISGTPKTFELLPAQFLGYGILFGVLYLLFRFHYHRPFWASLRWVPSPYPASRVMALGILLAVGVALSSLLLRTPDLPTPMKELLSDRTSVILIALFGITLGPLVEELAFRGFMQPLFVRSLGTVAGIVVAALPFGILHLPQYGFSWRHGLLITLAGSAFGWMRHKTGSTLAATVMHAAYNATFFMALAAQHGDFPVRGWGLARW